MGTEKVELSSSARSGHVLNPVLGGMALNFAATFAAGYYYEHVYLSTANLIERKGIALMFAKHLNLSRESGFFTDKFSQPFPTDEELKNGVMVDLVYEGDLRTALRQFGVERDVNARKITVLNKLLIHIVEQNGVRYWQVQQLRDTPNERGSMVDVIMRANQNVIGTDPAFNTVK